MDKRSEINDGLKAAMREKDQVALSTIRLINAALKDRDIAARGQGNPDGLNDSEILSMLQSMIKQRNESVKTYQDAGREDLADRELAEIEVIRRFLPKELSEDEVQAVIDSLIAELGANDIKDMGQVMGTLKTRYAGQVDMAKAGGIVRSRLG